MNKSICQPAAFALSCLCIASCGGGGGGSSGSPGTPSKPGGNTGSPLKAVFNTDALTFSAAAPFDLIALTQKVTATVTPTGNGAANGTLYVLIEVRANSFFSVPEALVDGSDSGHATVQVVDPQQLGPGTYDGSFVVRLCLNSQSCAGSSEILGSPHAVAVHYTIGDLLDGDTVTPDTTVAGTAGSLILRGRGFTPTTMVSIGGTAPTSVTYVSPTQLNVQYPPLSFGSYPMVLNGGSTQFQGALSAIPPKTYSYGWIPHQSVPSPVTALVYNPYHDAIVYCVSSSTEMRLFRYRYSAGVWVADGDADGTGITQLRMSHDGSAIVALRTQQFNAAQLVDLNPTTLGTIRETSIDPSTWSFTLANDGNYVLAKRFPGSGGGLPPDLLGSISRKITTAYRLTFNAFESVSSGDGSKVVVFGDSREVGIYDAATFTWTSVKADSPAGDWSFPQTTSANLAGTRFASLGEVTDENMRPIGQAPRIEQNAPINATGNALLNSDGSRLYVYDIGDFSQGAPTGRLRTYDVNASPQPPANTRYPVLTEIGSGIVLANNPHGVYTSQYPARMALTLDGKAIIICGVAGCVVQPTPP
jgi:hypothetical protein